MKTDLCKLLFRLRNTKGLTKPGYMSSVKLWDDGCYSVNCKKLITLPHLQWKKISIAIADIKTSKTIRDSGIVYEASYEVHTPYGDIISLLHDTYKNPDDYNKDIIISIIKNEPIDCDNHDRRIVTIHLQLRDYTEIERLETIPQIQLELNCYTNLVISDWEYEEFVSNMKKNESPLGISTFTIHRRDWNKLFETDISSGRSYTVYAYTHCLLSDGPITIEDAFFTRTKSNISKAVIENNTCSIYFKEMKPPRTGTLTICYRKEQQ